MAAKDTRNMADAVATQRLGIPLSDWLAARRAEGMAWEHIQEMLTRATDGVVDVHWTTLRRWAA